MKTKILSLIFIFSILIGASSCSKDGDSISSMKADIDGNVWTASVLSVVGAKYSNYITIVGFDLTGGEQIFISIKGTTVGTYEFNALEATANTYGIYLKNKDATTGEDDSNKYLTTSGTVEITAISDNFISGTFSFNAKNSLTDPAFITITNGVFNNVAFLNL